MGERGCRELFYELRPERWEKIECVIPELTAEELCDMMGVKCEGLIRQPKVDKIIRSGPCTIVFWMDGTKTIVRCAQDEQDNVYTAFCAALGKRIYGSNSALKREINARLK